ncbi:MAG: nicotinate phosphoribosyltransferase, partial [Defluviitaleaceae bacterium]|nr:nicotinate phosphoribosyltransferase [Defluviitaleaceae bacterium]
LASGVPNAITVFKEMRENGTKLTNYGIRLDSGDFAYLSKKARQMLDKEGFNDAIICASSDLDEHLIINLRHQGAEISLWGVGTNLITSRDCPAFGGVYKLSADVCEGLQYIPKIKVSDNTEKITNPGFKKIFRLYDKKTSKIKADLIALYNEEIDTTKDLTIFHPINTWKKMTLLADEFTTRELLVPIFKNGECVYTSPSVMEIRDYCREELNTLWDEFKRITNPHIMPVDLSLELYNLKKEMIEKIRHGNV